MDPPSPGSDGGGGGGGADTSPSRPQPSSINQMAFCHECGIEIRPLMTPDPTCPRCNGQFVEIIEGGRLGDEEDDDEINNPFAPAGGDPFPGFIFRTGSTQGGGSLPQTLSSLLMAMASGAASVSNASGSPRDAHAQDSSHQQPSRNAAAEGQDAAHNRQQSSSTTRSGTSSFGPFGLQWNVQYGSGGGNPYQEQSRRAAEQPAEDQIRRHDLQSPPTLSNFLRFAFGGAESTDETAQRQDTYFHDDGMGGAGGVADGRHFNHDNRGTYHQPPQSPESDPAGQGNEDPRAGGGDGRNNNNNNDLPPELGALRNLFTGLFGQPGAHGGSLLDLLAAGAQGGAGGTRGQWGDYVLGQQGLDDIITQLMEQTQGSTAPPPATEDVIEDLERFTLHDKQRIEKARNQDCPTCKDEFLPSVGEAKEDDEGGEQLPQQEELISMPCGHIFHEDCLVPWLKLHGTCPVCRISIVKAREGQEEASGDNDSGNAAQRSQGAQNDNAAATRSEPIPNGWPSPPNPFTSFFNGSPAAGVQVPRDPSAATTTTTYHPLPPTSTTVTSTVYTTPAAAAGTPGLADVEVVNSIVSSPPIVSDREAYFDEQPDREEMRETLRRAAEARTRREQPWLEPDELD